MFICFFGISCGAIKVRYYHLGIRILTSEFLCQQEVYPYCFVSPLFQSLSISLSRVFWKLFSRRVLLKSGSLIVETNGEIERCGGESGEMKQQGSMADLPKLRPYLVNFDIHTNYREFQRKPMQYMFFLGKKKQCMFLFLLPPIFSSEQFLGRYSILHSRVRCSLSLSLSHRLRWRSYSTKPIFSLI